MRRALPATAAAVAAALGVAACVATPSSDAPDPTRVGTSTSVATTEDDAVGIVLPPPGAGFDYQIGGDYPLAVGIEIVTRDWFASPPADDAYDICYVNAFQTQPDDPDEDRPDERSNWPAEVVLTELADDPAWEGEFLVDLSTPDLRARAAEHVAPMTDRCAAKGYDAVEFDNLDSWTRFGAASDVPFGKAEAIDYARRITAHAHASGLAVGQKNAVDLTAQESLDQVGFDFAVVEDCAAFDECEASMAVFGNLVLDVEYDRVAFEAACAQVGHRISVVRRDIAVTTPDEPQYVFDTC